MPYRKMGHCDVTVKPIIPFAAEHSGIFAVCSQLSVIKGNNWW
ncbi:MAG: hypothetical protein JWR54_3863 [Mucilaginibacter sp.]|jgi:hypothetical protein|nr:hypothetical protein [Mucilaginibacter sp.]